MKKTKIIFIAVIAAVLMITLAVCSSTGGSSAGLPPTPPGAEKVTLENGAYAIYKFALPDGATWANYNRLTVDYMVDAENLRKAIRNTNAVRLMGVYRENTSFINESEYFGITRYFDFGDGPESHNAPYILDNAPRTFATMGAAANQWFTVQYNISGSAAHAQFNRANLPAPTARGPFFFGVGIPGHGNGIFEGITQLIRNVTLHHATDPSLNVVSTNSGFAEPTFASFNPPLSTRESGPAAQ